MSRNQRARRKEKHIKQKQDARLRRPSKSAIWNEVCNRAEELMDQDLWSEAREVLEAVDRSHPGGICVLNRLAWVYEELGETDCLDALNCRRNSSLNADELVRRFIDVEDRFDDVDLSRVKSETPKLLMLNFKIDDDPVDDGRSPQILEWSTDGYYALLQGNGREAEVLFKKCIESAGEAPDLVNNLAAAYQLQGRNAEGHELACAVHAKWPEYLFGRIHMANRATKEKRFDVAEQYLEPLLTRKRFHITEFRAMVTAYLQLEIARNRLEAAQGWIDVWRTIEPDHDDLEKSQQLIEALSILDTLQNWRR